MHALIVGLLWVALKVDPSPFLKGFLTCLFVVFGLSIAAYYCFTSIEVECDSQVAIQMLKAHGPTLSPTSSLVDDIRLLASSFSFISFFLLLEVVIMLFILLLNGHSFF